MNPERMRKRVLHSSFVVKDIYDSINAFLSICDIGPWYVFEHVPTDYITYRGSPAKIDFSLAVAYSGAMMIELIQQNDDGPSAYKDMMARSYGFHHFAIPSYDYERDLARYQTLGFAIATEAAAGGHRAAYVDTTARLPGMIELVDMVPEVIPALRELQAIADNWDGTEPIRPFKLVR